jgi:glycosyltransferase involved in cell wall biosynthesis
MKILCVNSYISEFGGAELSALKLADGLAKRGHEVHFLGARLGGSDPEAMRYGDVHLHYETFPRPYPLGKKGHIGKKALWHLQDLVGPANERIFGEVLKRIVPDVVILHNTTGVGQNIWRTLRRYDVPALQVIHDLGIICLNKARFRNARQCKGLCALCRLQMELRFFWLRDVTQLSFVSPSRAVLNEIGHFAPLKKWRCEVIPNPNSYITKPRLATADQSARLLYVGRVDPSKGVDFMLRAAKRARDTVKLDFDVVGTGMLERALRSEYAGSNWVTFHGQVDQTTIAELMSRAAVLLVPSLWLENFPGVAVHALFAGLPILASDIGGIPEIVDDDKTGRLLTAGDEKAWADAIVNTLTDTSRIARWSAACIGAAQRFGADVNLDAYQRLIQQLAAREATP